MTGTAIHFLLDYFLLILTETLGGKSHKHPHFICEEREDKRACHVSKVPQVQNGRAGIHVQVDMILNPFIITVLPSRSEGNHLLVIQASA